MRVSIQTLGTRGDVQPYVALARSLKAHGHEPTLLAPRDFTAFIEAHHIRAAEPLDIDMGAFAQEAVARGVMRNPLKIASIWRDMVEPMIAELLDKCVAAARGADVVVSHPKAYAAATGAEAAGAAHVLTALQPIIAPTAAFPCPGLWARDLGGALNRASYLPLRYGMAPYAGPLNRRREELGLAPVSKQMELDSFAGRPQLRLVAASRTLFDRPADWPASVHLTGAWFLSSDNAPLAPELAAFLQAGPPPVYVGFGSMPAEDAKTLSAIVLDALSLAGERGVVLKGWAGLDAPPREDVLLIDAAPHDQLFPRCKAVAHHGGAGTVHAALRAGVPQVTVPFYVDQPWHARRLREKKLTPPPAPRWRLTPQRLAAAIRKAIDDPAYGTAARAAAKIVAGEDGLGHAARLIEEETASHRSSAGR
ncbi:MAG: glycosyltransferase [Caulobacterales bacterium]|nr:glycosyltransferase [Caulobacterales bacterium]